jgi:hypothetical protein
MKCEAEGCPLPERVAPGEKANLGVSVARRSGEVEGQVKPLQGR